MIANPAPARRHHYRPTCRQAVLAAILMTVLGGCADSLPVVASYRESLWGEGKVVKLSNQANGRLTVRVEQIRDGQPVKAVNIDLPAQGDSELGWMEDFSFADGDMLEISHPNYQTSQIRLDF